MASEAKEAVITREDVDWAMQSTMHIFRECKRALNRAQAAEQRAEEAERKRGEVEMENNQIREALAAARQACENLRNHHKHMAAEFELIAAGKHPRYWTLEPGDVLLRPICEVRPPKKGEWYPLGASYHEATVDHVRANQSIYRRIDAPAAAEPAAVQGTESVPVSANTQAKVHAILHERGFSGYESPPVSEQPKLTEWQPVRRLDGDGYAVRRDLAGGGCEHIGMPLLFNDARILAAYHNGRLHEVKPVPPVSEQEGERARLRRAASNLASHVALAKVNSTADWLEGAATRCNAVAECLGDTLRLSSDGKAMTHRWEPAPAAESGKWEAFKSYESNHYVAFVAEHNASGNKILYATQEQCRAAADWLNRRAEIESQLAQLAKYKRDADAWERGAGGAVENYKLSQQTGGKV